MKRTVNLTNYREPGIQDKIRDNMLKIARERRLSVRGLSTETGVNRSTLDKFIDGVGIIGLSPLCSIEDWIIEHIIEE